MVWLRLQEAGLPLWLRPYEVLCTSNNTSLIELVPNTLSLHAIKARSLPGTSLRAHFTARYGEVSSGLGRCRCCEHSLRHCITAWHPVMGIWIGQ
jgi:phosphatidylinositol 4-kinase